MTELEIHDVLALRIGQKRAERKGNLSGHDAAVEDAVRSNDFDGSEANQRNKAGDKGEVLLRRLCDIVEVHLPWRSSSTGLTVQMRVADAGYLDWEHPLFPKGTPYVLVVADSPEAASAVREALASIARLDEGSWILDWAREPGAYASIQVFPALM